MRNAQGAFCKGVNKKMKWFIASDIHGSEYYCKKMLEAFERERADRILLLGDLLYHGPRNDLPKDYSPKAVAALLNGVKEKIFCVRGNCEAEVDQMLLEFPVMADYILISAENRLIFATHGHKYIECTLALFSKGDILLHGHTHVPKCTEYESFLCINPGSVSIPKEESRHGYMTLEGKIFRWFTLEGEQRMEYIL